MFSPSDLARVAVLCTFVAACLTVRFGFLAARLAAPAARFAAFFTPVAAFRAGAAAFLRDVFWRVVFFAFGTLQKYPRRAVRNLLYDRGGSRYGAVHRG